MATRRIDVNVTSPSTEFVMDADMVSQSQAGNYSTVYYWLGAINRGGTTSYDAANSSQSGYVAGGGGGAHTSTIPSGVSAGATRWYDGPWGINLGHDANGYRNADQVQQNIGWSWGRVDYGSIGPYPRIPKPPSPTTKPVLTNITPKQVRIDWTWSGDNGGATLDSFLVRRWTGSAMTGAYSDVYNGPSSPFFDNTVQPGTTYTYGVYAHNVSAGYSAVSAGTTIKTLAPVHVRVAGVWKYAVPYVKVSGVWKMATPYVKVAGTWHQTG